MTEVKEVAETIGVREAVKTAKEYFSALSEENLTTTILEEVERTDDSWLITFGYTTKDVFVTRYKIIELNNETGEFVAMKIRTLS